MPRTTERERVNSWQDRITVANKLYDKWSTDFETERCENYYEGVQWRGISDEEAKKLYTINLVFSSIEVNKPSLIFYRPQARIQPRPNRMSTFGSEAEARAQLCEDTVQTFIDDPDINFAQETALALQESHFRYGMIEVGYTPDWIDNPNAGKPVLKEDEETPVKDSSGQPVMQPERILKDEQLYVKRIPAQSFRVSISNVQQLEKNDWVAYYEWHYLEDIKRNKNYENTKDLKATGLTSDTLREKLVEDPLVMESRHGMVKLWKIWDMRERKRYVIVEGHPKFLVDGKPFKFLPFAPIKFFERLKSFYPVPPVYQWLGPQDEINETREGQRAHRRRFYRRYTYVEGSIDDLELQKLEQGGDGVCAKANVPNPLVPVPDAPLSGDQWRHLDESKTDFMAVSGVGGEQRGVAESETATQANIIDTRARLREASARTKVADWLSKISRLILLTVRDNMALPIWIQRNVDVLAAQQSQMMKMQQAAMMAQQTGQPPMPPPPDEDILRTSQLWQEITSDMLGDTDLDVYIDLASMSPITEEVQRNSWNQVLALLTNQQILFVMAMSPVLLRKTLSLYGIRSEQEIQEVQRVAQMVIGMQMQMAQQQQIQGAAEAAGKAGVNPQLVQALTQEAQGGINGASPGTSAIPEAQSMMSDLSAVGGGPPIA